MSGKAIKWRKVLLLAATGALAIIYIAQLVASRPDSVRVLTPEGAIDTITITRPGSEGVTLTKSDGVWLVGSQGFKADGARVDSMLSTLGSLKVLATVSSNPEGGEYGLTEGSSPTVEAFSSGKKVRALTLGKAAGGSLQSYALVDGKTSVSLVAGNLRDLFDRSVEDLRSKEVWNIDQASLDSVSGSARGSAFEIRKAGDGLAWTVVSPKGLELDAEKANAWVSSLLALKAQSFGSLDGVEASKPEASITIRAGGKDYSLTVYAKGEDGTYPCSSSETAWPFRLSSWTAEKFLKGVDDLRK